MTNLTDLLTQWGVPFAEEGHHHCRPGWVQMDCPVCGHGTRKFHLGFHLSLRYFNCWRCGGLHPHRVIRLLARCGEDQARQIYAGIDKDRTLKPERTRTQLVEPPHRGPLMKAHREALRERGFDPKEIVSIWGVEGIGPLSSLKWRLYIPIEFRRERLSWTTRAISPDTAQRYVSASADQEAVNHKHLVYGIDNCHHSIVIVEGPTDAWNVGPGAGALFGTAFSTAQVSKLADIPNRFVCFDNSIEAQKRARDLVSHLIAFPGSTTNVVLDAEDPGSASRKEIRSLRRLAKLD